MNFLHELKNQKKEQEELIEQLKRHKKAFKNLPRDNIKVLKNHNTYQCYVKRKEDRYRYVPKSEIKGIQDMLQRDYEESLLKTLQKNCAMLSSMIKRYDLSPIDKDYESLSEGRRKLVDPVIVTDEKYIEAWYEEHPGERNCYFGDGEYLTDRGESVRSKSEKIIADLFNKRGIPYSYEPELFLKDGSKVYPDFMLLNVRERKTYIWEHFGLLSDDEYAAKNMRKLMKYDMNGIHLGYGLITSSESDNSPLKLSEINLKIETFLL